MSSLFCCVWLSCQKNTVKTKGGGPVTSGTGSDTTKKTTQLCTSPAQIDMTGAVLFGDGTAGSITQAKLQALINTGGKIIFNGGSQPVTLTLTAPLVVPNIVVVIDGKSLLTISGNNAVRIFDKLSAPNNGGTLLGLQNMNLTAGSAPRSDELGGAAIRGEANGSLSINSVNFDSNNGPVMQPDGSGAVHTVVYQNASFVNCVFTNNKGANGGAVGCIGTPTSFINCRFDHNQATGTGGTRVNQADLSKNGGIGGAIYDDGVNQGHGANTYSLCGCVFTNNHANHQAGAANIVFYFDQGSSAVINNCEFDNNSCTEDNGGALYYMNGSFTISNSTFYKNSTPNTGGAAWIDLDGGSTKRIGASVFNCTFDQNTAASGTTGGLGGGIWIGGNIDAAFTYCTFAENTAGLFASAIMNGSNLTLTNNVFYNNYTGKAYQGNADAGATINKGSTLTVGKGNLQFPSQFTSAYGTRTEDWMTADVLSVDAMLATLAANGSLLQTMALKPGSGAISKATAQQGITTDERGLSRKSAPDIGAYESQ